MPQTQLESEKGHKGTAGQIPGLKFPAQSSGGMQVPMGGLTQMTQFKFRSSTEKLQIASQLRDFSFRELHPEALFLWIVKFSYFLTVLAGIIVVALMFLGAIFTLISGEFAVAVAYFISGIVCCVLFPIYLILVRFTWEWSIITFHYSIQWLIGFAKLPHALCHYLEEKSRR